MARTAAGAALTQQHRGGQLVLRAGLLRDLTRLWPLFDPTDFDTFSRFASVAAVLVGARHRDSAGLASRYLGAFRLAEGLTDEVTPVLPSPLPEAVTRDALRATGAVGYLNARRAGFSIDAARQNGFVRVAGSASSLMLHGARDTILGTVARDRQSQRWQRTTSSSPCSFCRMLAGRGAVFSESSVGFEAHDHCACVPEPVYSTNSLGA